MTVNAKADSPSISDAKPLGPDERILADAASVRRYAMGPFLAGSARLAIPGAGPGQLAPWEHRLGLGEEACGCHEGAAAVLIALLLLALQGAGFVDLPAVGTGALAWVAVLFAAALLGKAIGLGLAAVRLWRLGNEIEVWERNR